MTPLDTMYLSSIGISQHPAFSVLGLLGFLNNQGQSQPFQSRLATIPLNNSQTDKDKQNPWFLTGQNILFPDPYWPSKRAKTEAHGNGETFP